MFANGVTPRVSVVCLSVCFGLLCESVLAGELDYPHEPTHILVVFNPGASASSRQIAHNVAAAQQVLSQISDQHSSLVMVQIPEGTIEAALAAYRSNPSVISAHPDYLVPVMKIPNDAQFGNQWGQRNTGQAINNNPEGVYDADTDLSMAWDIETGDPNMVIAVIDSGVHRTYDDFHNGSEHNIWVNNGECPGGYGTCQLGDLNNDGRPGVQNFDDDGDGKVDEDSQGRQAGEFGYTNDLVNDDDEDGFNDDFYGWDFVGNPSIPDNDPTPAGTQSHGTNMAGIIGAMGNNQIGVSGVMWRCKIMILRVGHDSQFNLGLAASAIKYARLKGAKVINLSLGDHLYYSPLYNEIRDAGLIAGIVVVAAAGQAPQISGEDNDVYPVYPASFGVSHTTVGQPAGGNGIPITGLDNVIAVAATTNADLLAYNSEMHSHYGRTHVHIGAPGWDVWTVGFGNSYIPVDGTSASTAYVSGIVGLLRSHYPTWTPAQIRARLISSRRYMSDLNGKTVANGEANAFKALLFDCNENGREDACDISCGAQHPISPCSPSPNCGGSPDQTAYKNDCCFPHVSPGCVEENPTEDIIEDMVCNALPGCCTGSWEQACANRAILLFPLTCSPLADGIIDSCQATRDCNCDGVIDFQQGLGGIPSQCSTVPYLTADTSGYEKSRFISFVPGSACPLPSESAIQVKLSSLHHVSPPYTGGPSVPFTAFEGQVRWVGPPANYSEGPPSGIAFKAARLQCSPWYQDWTTVGLLHVTGSAIVPSSVYEVSMVGANCSGSEDSCVSVSSPLVVQTTRWGDVEMLYSPSPGQPDFGDITAMVNKFKGLAGAPIKARTLLLGDVDGGNINIVPDLNFNHVAVCVDAFRGKPYPHEPCGCGTGACIPCTFPNNTPCTGAGNQCMQDNFCKNNRPCGLECGSSGL